MRTTQSFVVALRLVRNRGFLCGCLSGRWITRVAILIVLGLSVSDGVRASDDASPPATDGGGVVLSGRDRDTVRPGDIQARGKAYRGNFGWFDAGAQEIEPDDGQTGVGCQTAFGDASAQIWDGAIGCSPETATGFRPIGGDTTPDRANP